LKGHIITMADRYQDRAFPAGGDYDRDGWARSSDNAESDPLAELARLIGQNDPFGGRPPIGRANLTVQPQARPAEPPPRSYDSYEDDGYADPEPEQPPAPPSWMQRAVRQEAPPPPPQEDYPSAVHPLQRYAAAHPPAEPEDYDPAHLFADTPHERHEHEPHEPDLTRYDDALYGDFDSQTQNTQHDQAYADDGYAYDEDHFEAVDEPRRRGGMITVVAVLALAVFGVGGAFAYRTYTGSARSGEPPIIRADAGPTKIIPAPADASMKVPDRMTTGDGTEKIVSREETPIDPAARSGPRVVFPPLTPNGSMPMPTGVVPPSAAPAASAPTGTFSNNEPHRVRTLSVRGDPTDTGTPAGAAPQAAPAKPAPRAAATGARTAAANPNAANANAPMSLSPQADAPAAAEPPPVRMAATNPVQQVAPSAPSTPSAAGSGSYLVSVTSQPSEADAQNSYRALQSKYPSVLGSQSAVVARANSKTGAVTYRAGPAFGSSAEAAQFCKSYAAAGGQCWVVKN
jgi:hypothetical protein